MVLVSIRGPFQRGASPNMGSQLALAGNAFDLRDFDLAGALVVQFQTIGPADLQRFLLGRVDQQTPRPPGL